MKNKLLILGFIIIGLLSCSSKNVFVKAAKNSTQSVVLIESYCSGEAYKYGTGVSVRKNGYIITCGHVVDDADSVVVVQGNDTMVSRIVGFNRMLDLCVLKVNKNIPTIKIGNSDKIKIGQPVMNVGYPMHLDKTFTSGIISSQLDATKYGLNVKFIQTDAVANGGNSGGPLIDCDGKILGMNDMLITTTGYYVGYSFAIPINPIMKEVDIIIDNDK